VRPAPQPVLAQPAMQWPYWHASVPLHSAVLAQVAGTFWQAPFTQKKLCGHWLSVAQPGTGWAPSSTSPEQASSSASGSNKVKSREVIGPQT
jgi:hypothetical protein